jgi:glutamyl-tRNA reductase
VDLRERFAIPDARLGALALELARVPELGESVVVSTCNRVEFYAAAPEAERAFGALHAALTERGMEPEVQVFFRRVTEDAARHLFRVVCGLDSMVLGETEILGQVKKAYQAAQEQKATARHLNKLFQRAFNVAKEVRTRTNITRGSVSVGSAGARAAANTNVGASAVAATGWAAGTATTDTRSLTTTGAASVALPVDAESRAAAVWAATAGCSRTRGRRSVSSA